jgi:hypothetical protein
MNPECKTGNEEDKVRKMVIGLFIFLRNTYVKIGTLENLQD